VASVCYGFEAVSTANLIDGNPGFGLVQHLVARDEVIVFAGVRDPASAKALSELASKHQGKLHIIKLVSADVANNHAAVNEIKKIASRLDVVVANAGIGESKPVLEASIESMQHHFTVNTLGTMVLAQATYPLLKASTDTPKFVAISSRIGSIAAGTGFPIPHVQYGASKAALNWMIKKLWTENPGLSQYLLHTP
jgi:NAD(P)-dependent dehydrogenase (short-subunit alcohol dehydrogenase family)